MYGTDLKVEVNAGAKLTLNMYGARIVTTN